MTFEAIADILVCERVISSTAPLIFFYSSGRKKTAP